MRRIQNIPTSPLFLNISYWFAIMIIFSYRMATDWKTLRTWHAILCCAKKWPQVQRVNHIQSSLTLHKKICRFWGLNKCYQWSNRAHSSPFSTLVTISNTFANINLKCIKLNSIYKYTFQKVSEINNQEIQRARINNLEFLN